jgi:hypothetical protein
MSGQRGYLLFALIFFCIAYLWPDATPIAASSDAAIAMQI